MTPTITVLVPVLGRPQRVAPLVASLRECSRFIWCEPFFLVSPDDDDELAEVIRSGASYVVVPWEPGRSDYARKMNYGFATTVAPFVLLGADDVSFHPGWAERALATWYETGACVIGTNDLGNSRTFDGTHSTHTLVHRDYGECGTVDGDTLLHEGYWHNFVDDEFIGTAKARGTYAAASDSHVEHLHPSWRKGEEDAIYKKGMEHWEDDRRYFAQRKRLW